MFNLMVALHTCFLDEELMRGEAPGSGEKWPATMEKFNPLTPNDPYMTAYPDVQDPPLETTAASSIDFYR